MQITQQTTPEKSGARSQAAYEPSVIVRFLFLPSAEENTDRESPHPVCRVGALLLFN